jgi:hypothetical protein
MKRTLRQNAGALALQVTVLIRLMLDRLLPADGFQSSG